MKNAILLICFFVLHNFLFSQEVIINNNLVIEADGTIRMDSVASVWDDVMIYPDATHKGGSNDPTWKKFKDNGSSSQGVFLWMYSSSSENEVYFTVQIPHGYKLGSSIYPHVHWTTASGTPSGSDVVWGLEYTVISIGGTFSNTSILTTNSVIPCITITGVGQHLISAFTPISGTNLGISAVLVCRLFRKTGDPNDTFSQEIGLLGVDFHVEKDTEGSRSEFAK